MIVVTKTIQINDNGEPALSANWNGPFTYEWITNDCDVIVSNPSGTTVNDTISANFTFDNEADAGGCNIQLQVTDSNGCTATITPEFENFCEDIEVEIIHDINDNVFVAQVSGGSGIYNYQWEWNDADWAASLGGTSKSLFLTPLSNAPAATAVSVTVTDATYQCERITRITHQFCTPTVVDTELTVPCDRLSNTTYGSASAMLNITPCNEQEINWNSVEIVSITYGGGNIANESFNIDIENGIVFVSPTVNLNAGSYVIDYNIDDILGQINVELSADCDPPQDQIIINDCNCSLDLCGVAPAASLCINLDDCVVNSEIDRSTVTIVQSPTAVGATAVYSATTNEVCYTRGAGTEAADEVHIQFDDINGVPSEVFVLQVNLTCTPDGTAPVITTPKTVCWTACSTTPTTINVTADIAGTYADLSTIEILTYPSQGTLTYDGAGIFSYNPGGILSSDVSFTYRVYNAGLTNPSNIGTVDIQGYCSGTYVNTATCNDDCMFDIVNLHTDFTTGGTYTYEGHETTFDGDNTNTAQVTGVLSGSEGTMGLPGIGATVTTTELIITGATAGFYYFTYDVGGACSDSKMLVLQVVDAPSAGTPTPQSITIPAPGPATTVTLATGLNGEDTGGTWSVWSGTDLSSITWNLSLGEAYISSGATAGTYVFRYTVETAATGDFIISSNCPSSCDSCSPIACADTQLSTIIVS